jgi:predicted transposase YdaD
LLSHEKQHVYRSLLKRHWDLSNSIEDARKQGKAEGILEGEMKGKLEVAKNLKRVGLSIDNIILATGLRL